MYSNDSPFWVTREHKRPDDIVDFLMPMRFLDLDSGGESGRDVALAELAASMRPVPEYLDWDDASAFVNFPKEASGTTAVAVGYPAELNGYTFVEPDNVPSANVVRKTFRGHIELDGDEVWFRNENHKEDFDYAGLSGGLVVCYAAGRPKCLGIAISRGDGGRRFRVLPFWSIRAWVEPFESQPWRVLDEAYFLRRMTHQQLSYAALHSLLQGGDEPRLHRTNEHLEQLTRSMLEPNPPYWVGNLRLLEIGVRVALVAELVDVLKKVLEQKATS